MRRGRTKSELGVHATNRNTLTLLYNILLACHTQRGASILRRFIRNASVVSRTRAQTQVSASGSCVFLLHSRVESVDRVDKPS